MTYLDAARAPLIERNPLLFWKGTTLLLLVIIAVLLFVLRQGAH